jgi:hypothetical protein
MGEGETENKLSWLDSDGFLGAMVVLLTIVTAFAAYQSALTSIEGDDLDFEAQKTLVLATASFQSGNSELLEDMYIYDSYRQFADQDPEEAAVFLNRASQALREGLDRPDGPFDEGYQEARFGDAFDLIKEVEKFEQQANLADDKARIFELAGFIFAIGLAAVAWASLVGTGRRIRLIFLLVAVVSLMAGFVVIIQVVFES